ncbi:hypothetical protein ACP275_12G072900 [Erythranthe tilingii]
MSQESFSSLPCPLDPDQTHPWLLLFHGSNLHNQTFYSISKDKALVDTKITEFRSKKAISTSHPSWLALIHPRKSSLTFSLLNTVTKQEILLPKIKEKPERSSYFDYACIFSETPTNPNCHVLFIGKLDTRLYYYRIGDEKFTSRPNKFGDDNTNELELASAVHYNGKIYGWMGGSRNFVQVDFIGGEIVIEKVVNDKGQPCHIPIPTPPLSFRYNEYLVASGDDVLLLDSIINANNPSMQVSHFNIFKIDACNGEWTELKSIGDRTIFLDPYGSKSWLFTNNGSDDENDDIRIKKNSIYYLEGDEILYVYDIEDRSRTLVKLPPVKRDWLMSWVVMYPTFQYLIRISFHIYTFRILVYFYFLFDNFLYWD